MACFSVPLAEALIVTAVKAGAFGRKSAEKALADGNAERGERIRAVRERLGLLEKLLYGGSSLLLIEHIYHGEITFVPPFITTMTSPQEISAMLREMATVGTGMAVLTTAVWGIMLAVSALLRKRAERKAGLSAAL